MSNIQTVEDAFDLGGLIVFTLFGYVAVASVWAADTTSEAVDAFAHSVTIMMLVAFPTSEFGVFLAVAMATVGGSISLSGRNPRLFAAALLAGTGWTGANILTNLVFGI